MNPQKTKCCERGMWQLSESQKEKMISLSEGVDYKDSEDFARKFLNLKKAWQVMKSSQKKL